MRLAWLLLWLPYLSLATACTVTLQPGYPLNETCTFTQIVQVSDGYTITGGHLRLGPYYFNLTGTARFVGVSFSHCSRRAIFAPLGQILLENCSFYNCSSNRSTCASGDYALPSGRCGGGAISGRSVLANNTHFIDCTSAADGGSILASEVHLTNVHIQDSFAAGDGGAVSCETLTTSNTHFHSCRSLSYGGAVMASAWANLLETNFGNCSAELIGGGLYTLSLLAERSNFLHCHCSIAGGYFAHRSNITYCNFDYCTTPYQNGAGGALSSKDLRADHCSFTNCKSNIGGAILAETSLDLTNSTFENCSADSRAGAVAFGDLGTNTRTPIIDCCTFKNCGATYDAGAVHFDHPYSASRAFLNRSSFYNCSSGTGQGHICHCTGSQALASVSEWFQIGSPSTGLLFGGFTVDIGAVLMPACPRLSPPPSPPPPTTSASSAPLPPPTTPSASASTSQTNSPPQQATSSSGPTSPDPNEIQSTSTTNSSFPVSPTPSSSTPSASSPASPSFPSSPGTSSTPSLSSVVSVVVPRDLIPISPCNSTHPCASVHVGGGQHIYQLNPDQDCLWTSETTTFAPDSTLVVDVSALDPAQLAGSSLCLFAAGTINGDFVAVEVTGGTCLVATPVAEVRLDVTIYLLDFQTSSCSPARRPNPF